MAVATWRVLAFGTLLGAVALPASAQVVIGGSGQPSVEVNWAVLDNLGRQPTLADLLKGEAPPALQAVPTPGKVKSSVLQGVQFKPYAPPKAAKAKVSAPRKVTATPVAAEAESDLAASPVATLVQATHKDTSAAVPPKPHAPEMAAPPAAAKAVAATASAGPQVSLPELSKPVAVPAQKVETVPVQKVETVPAQKVETVPAQKVETVPVQVAEAVTAPAAVSVPVQKAESVPTPVPVAAPAALTPPPLPTSEPQVAALPPLPTSEPQVAALPPLPTPEPQVAALPPVPAQLPMSVVSSKGDTLSVVFGGDSATLPGTALPELDKLIKRLRKDDGLGLQLLAFAEGDDANASKARRLSLSRALEVRKYLMDQGVRSTRIEVRALGNKLEGAGPADRVDAVVVSR